MPYRVDLPEASEDALDRLIELGALDVEVSRGRGAAALMPDSVTPEEVRCALGAGILEISPAVGRDAGSVWVLSPRPVQIGRVRIVPAHMNAEPGTIRLIDAPAFGTGLPGAGAGPSGGGSLRSRESRRVIQQQLDARV